MARAGLVRRTPRPRRRPTCSGRTARPVSPPVPPGPGGGLALDPPSSSRSSASRRTSDLSRRTPRVSPYSSRRTATARSSAARAASIRSRLSDTTISPPERQCAYHGRSVACLGVAIQISGADRTHGIPSRERHGCDADQPNRRPSVTSNRQVGHSLVADCPEALRGLARSSERHLRMAIGPPVRHLNRVRTGVRRGHANRRRPRAHCPGQIRTRGGHPCEYPLARGQSSVPSASRSC